MNQSRIKQFIRPSSIEDAVQQLAAGGGKLIPISGGISVRLAGARQIDGVVDLSSLDLNYIREDGDHVLIGATTPVRDLELSPVAQSVAHGMLSQSARCIATLPLRNIITAGGDLVQCYYWSCLPPALLALKGEVKIASPGGEKWISAEDFFAKHPKTSIKAGDILIEIRVPRSAGADVKAEFTTFKRVDSEYAIVNLAALLKLKGGVVAEARLALGAVSILPRRLTSAEAALAGKPLNAETIAAAVAAAEPQIDPIADIRTSPEYRRELCGVMLRRTLETLS